MALRITGLGEEIAAVTGLPWQTSLENWPEDPLLTEKRGISRHIVRLVRASDDTQMPRCMQSKKRLLNLLIVNTKFCVNSNN